ncbi:hypothetical protein PsorP6_001782 [Peronosclerospora sorghi]|uniref:Uncharacterized protein n=1 Tax=Peronosclerospora sorghi TaxID=230839 RepID=A0ACC0WVR4_9STRA|nr:hypothetical protein PsorP6_001782 [Peronosclerospora sorghi]
MELVVFSERQDLIVLLNPESIETDRVIKTTKHCKSLARMPLQGCRQIFCTRLESHERRWDA